MNDKFAYYGVWNPKRHNNCRYTMLLPRLRLVEPKYHTLSRFRFVGYIQEFIYQWVVKSYYVPRVARLYRCLFCTDVSQIRLFQGPVLVDIDDPDFV